MKNKKILALLTLIFIFTTTSAGASTTKITTTKTSTWKALSSPWNTIKSTKKSTTLKKEIKAKTASITKKSRFDSWSKAS